MFTSAESVLGRARLAYVAVALLVYIASVPLSAWRWRAILRGLNERLPLGRLMLVNLAGTFVNNVTPGARAGGEVCRIAALTRMRLTAVTGAASVAYERLSELPAVAALVLIGAASVSPRSAYPIAATIAVAACALGIAAFVIRRLAVGSRWLESTRTVRIAPSALAAGAAMSVLLWTLDVLRLRMAAATMRASIDLPQAAALAALTIAAGWVPTIGGLGAIEGGLIGGLIAFGVAPADAAAITAIERVISYGLATIAGGAAMAALGGGGVWKAVRAR